MTSPKLHGRSTPATTTRQTAQYVSDLVLELRNLAKAEKLTALGELLELAYYEAFMQAHKVELPVGEHEYLQRLQLDVMRAEAE